MKLFDYGEVIDISYHIRPYEGQYEVYSICVRDDKEGGEVHIFNSCGLFDSRYQAERAYNILVKGDV